MSQGIGYEDDRCHFNFPGCKKTHAGYARADEKGEFFDACENCVRVPLGEKNIRTKSPQFKLEQEGPNADTKPTIA